MKIKYNCYKYICMYYVTKLKCEPILFIPFSFSTVSPLWPLLQWPNHNIVAHALRKWQRWIRLRDFVGIQVLSVSESSIRQLLCLDGSLLGYESLLLNGAMRHESRRLILIFNDSVCHLRKTLLNQTFLLLLEMRSHMAHFRCSDFTVKESFVVL